MVKVVYNACYGGFSFSRKAAERLAQLGMEEAEQALREYDESPSVFGFSFNPYTTPRHDPLLVQVVEELEKESSGPFAKLRVAEIEGNKYIVDEYDGNETVQTPDSIDWIEV